MNNIQLNIVANAQFQQVYAEVAKLKEAMLSLQKASVGGPFAPGITADIRATQAAFDSAVMSTRAFTIEHVAMTNSINKFGKQLASGQLSLSNYYKIWRDSAKGVSAELDALAASQARLNRSVAIADPLRPGYAKLITDINGVVTAQEKAIFYQRALNTALQQGSIKLINFGKNTQWMGRQLSIGLTMPLAMFGAAASAAFYQVDKELTRMVKVYGKGITQPTKQALAEIRKDALALGEELARTMGVSVKDTASMAADLAATGLEGKKLIDATRQALRLSVLGELDKQQAMQATISLQNVYKLSTKGLTEAVDFLNAVENQTSTSLQDLVDAIPRVGPIVQQLGGSFKDTAAMMVAMKEAGVPAAQGANAIKSVMASLINPTTNAKNAFKAFNIDLLSISSKNAGNPIAMLKALSLQMENIDRLSKAQLIEKLFGKYQFSRVQALLDNINKVGSQTSTVFNLMSASSVQLAKLSDNEIKQHTASASGKFKIMVESLKANIIPMGRMFLDVFTKIGNALNKMLQIFRSINKIIGPALAPLKFLFGGGMAGLLLAGPILMLTGLFANLIGNIFRGVNAIRMFKQGMASAAVGENAFLAGLHGMRNFYAELDKSIIASRNQMSLMPEAITSNAKAFDILNASIRSLTIQFEALAAAQRASMMGGMGSITGSFLERPLGAKLLPIVARNRGGAIPGFSKGSPGGVSIVPGPDHINYDSVLGNVPVGGYVLNKQASKKLLRGYNSGGHIAAMLTPGELIFDPKITGANKQTLEALNNGYSYGGLIRSGVGNYGPLGPSLVENQFFKSILGKELGLTETQQLAKVVREVHDHYGFKAGDQGKRAIFRYLGQTPRYNPATGSVEGSAILMDKAFGKFKSEADYDKFGSRITPDGKVIVGYARKGTSGLFGYAEDYGSLVALNSKKARKGLFDNEILQYLNASKAYGKNISGVERVYGSTDVFLSKLPSQVVSHQAKEDILTRIDKFYSDQIRGKAVLTDANDPYFSVAKSVIDEYSISNPQLIKLFKEFSRQESAYNPAYLTELKAGRGQTGSKTIQLRMDDGSLIKYDELAGYRNGNAGALFFHAPGEMLKLASGGFIKGNRSNYGPFPASFYEGLLGAHESMAIAKTAYRTMGTNPQIVESLINSGKYTQEEIAKGLLRRYAEGDYSIIKVKNYWKHINQLREKTSGTFFRGLTVKSRPGGQNINNGLPAWLNEEIALIKQINSSYVNWGNLGTRLTLSEQKAATQEIIQRLIGKEFIMGPRSWSQSKNVARMFANMGYKDQSFLLKTQLQNTGVIPVSKLLPSVQYSSGQTMNEFESLFGGKFQIANVGVDGIILKQLFKNKGGRIEAREDGGPVSFGKPYLVGESGPELFVPGQSGNIVPRFGGGGDIQEFIGNKGVVTRAYGPGSLPYAPGLNPFNPMINAVTQSSVQYTSAMRVAGEQLKDAPLRAATNIQMGKEKLIGSINKLGTDFSNKARLFALSTNRTMLGPSLPPMLGPENKPSFFAARQAGTNFRNTMIPWLAPGGLKGSPMYKQDMMMKGMGLSMAVPLAMNALPSKIGGTDISVAKSTLGTAATMAGFAMMMGPAGAALAAPIAGLIIGVKTASWAVDTLKKRHQEHAAIVRETYTTSTSAVMLFNNSLNKTANALAINISQLKNNDPLKKVANYIKGMKSPESVIGTLKTYAASQVLGGMDPDKVDKMVKAILIYSGKANLIPQATREITNANKDLATSTETYIKKLAQGVSITDRQARGFKDLSDGGKNYANGLYNIFSAIQSGNMNTKQLDSILTALSKDTGDATQQMKLLKMAANDAGNTQMVGLQNAVEKILRDAGQAKFALASLMGLPSGVDASAIVGMFPNDPKGLQSFLAGGKTKDGKTLESVVLAQRAEALAAIKKQQATANAGENATAGLKKQLKILESQKKTLDAQIRAEEQKLNIIKAQNDYLNKQTDLTQQIKEAEVRGEYLRAAQLQTVKQQQTAEYTTQKTIDAKKAQSDELGIKISDLNAKITELATAAQKAADAAAAFASYGKLLTDSIPAIKAAIAALEGKYRESNPKVQPGGAGSPYDLSNSKNFKLPAGDKSMFNERGNLSSKGKQEIISRGLPRNTYFVYTNPQDKKQYLYHYDGYNISKAMPFTGGLTSDAPNVFVTDTPGGTSYVDPKSKKKVRLPAATGGFVTKFENGGRVSGPGTWTSDSIPALLSNHEFVMNSAAVNKYGLGLMYALNNKSYQVPSSSYPYFPNIGKDSGIQNNTFIINGANDKEIIARAIAEYAKVNAKNNKTNMVIK